MKRSMKLAVPATLGLSAISGFAGVSADTAAPEPVSAKEAAALVESAGSNGLLDSFYVNLRGEVKYDDNIFLTPDNEESDTIFSLIPVVGFDSARGRVAKSSFTAEYAPVAAFYADNSGLDYFNNNGSVALFHQMPKTTFRANADYRERSDASRFINDLVDRSIFDAGLDVSHILSGKTRLDAGAGFNASNYDDDALFDYDTWDVSGAALYRATGKISVGPYVGFGQTEVSNDQPTHEFWSAGGKVDYQFTGKTRFTGTVGYETRSFSGANAADDKSTVVWNFGLDHRLTGKTKVLASIYRKDNPSMNIAGAGYEATGVVLGTTYTYSPTLSFNGGLTYEHNEYFRTVEGSTLSRDNDYWKFNVGAVWSPTDKLDLGGRVLYRLNDSTDAANEFENLQLALDATYKFW
ncbi:outer membrane beta-barrel protein [Sulfuriroseicoccus oceanibius]|uniref:Outer membrane beta-barrel protein n=1 Tax=Sulfuriroseicoccus oceanibius TaxID=2707525 RepID=A0A6B3L7F4_9BACT|nr:outer membrane beta-barrel protein [Sulfuriroseicoccus oceanibius]QQL44321.1 outer membrane beta-barrel protein [Sulfuriroseicoccus oceanibius]